MSARYQESGLFLERQGGIILRSDVEENRVGPRLAFVVGDVHLYGDRLHAGRRDLDPLRTLMRIPFRPETPMLNARGDSVMFMT